MFYRPSTRIPKISAAFLRLVSNVVTVNLPFVKLGLEQLLHEGRFSGGSPPSSFPLVFVDLEDRDSSPIIAAVMKL